MEKGGVEGGGGEGKKKSCCARQKPLAGSRVAARQIASYIRGVGTRAQGGANTSLGGKPSGAGRERIRGVYTHGKAATTPRRLSLSWPIQRQSRKITIVHNRRVAREGLFRIIHPRRGGHDPYVPPCVIPSPPVPFLFAFSLSLDPKYLSEIHDKHDSRT